MNGSWAYDDGWRPWSKERQRAAWYDDFNTEEQHTFHAPPEEGGLWRCRVWRYPGEPTWRAMVGDGTNQNLFGEMSENHPTADAAKAWCEAEWPTWAAAYEATWLLGDYRLHSLFGGPRPWAR